MGRRPDDDEENQTSPMAPQHINSPPSQRRRHTSFQQAEACDDHNNSDPGRHAEPLQQLQAEATAASRTTELSLPTKQRRQTGQSFRQRRAQAIRDEEEADLDGSVDNGDDKWYQPGAYRVGTSADLESVITSPAPENDNNTVAASTVVVSAAHLAPDKDQLIAEEVARIEKEIFERLQQDSARDYNIVVEGVREETNSDVNVQQRRQQTRYRRKSIHVASGVLCLFIVLLVGVIIGVFLAGKAKDNEVQTALPPAQAPPSDPPISASETMMPTANNGNLSSMNNRFDRLVDLLGTLVSDKADAVFTNPTTFEYKTMTWLADRDTWRMQDNEEDVQIQMWVERYALAYLKISTLGWLHDYNFLQPTSVCDWNYDQVIPHDDEPYILNVGVTCREDTVVELHLHDNIIIGSLPTQLALLTNLQALYIQSNKGLIGTIPEELFVGGLSDLDTLSLRGAGFTGTLSTKIGQLSSLTTLDFTNNFLTGAIPTELGQLTGVSYLDFSYNALNGTIPTEIGYLTDLALLYLEGNDLTGPIPSEMGALTDVFVLYLYHNQLQGTVPMELSAMTSLSDISIESNNLQGHLDEVFCGNSNAEVNELRADCGGDAPEVTCSCCTTCCDEAGACFPVP